MPESAPIDLTTPLSATPAIPPPMLPALAALGLTNVGRLIAHLPMRHERIEAEAPIAAVKPGHIVSTRGEIVQVKVNPRRPRPRIEVALHDGTGRLDVLWFNALYLRDKLRPGVRIWVMGKAQRYGRSIRMANPRFEVLRDDAEPAPREARVRPVYPASEGVTSSQIERCLAGVLQRALPLIEDHLTPEFREARGMPELREAYRMMHLPRDEDEPRRARRRLAYDELLLLQLGVHLKRAHLRQTLRAPPLRWSETLDAHIRERFPFVLTAAQDKVVREIAADLAQTTPANRLIQGDVGSGKTIVALYAMLQAAASRHQGCLMAPTEILAEQHFGNISRVLAGSKVRVELLTGSLAPAERERVLAAAADGSADILVGTHALLTSDVRFKGLAVAIIDEQHRFGVVQRGTLRASAGDERTTPHVLVMTATPIPRTLAITLFGDLDLSVIEGMPPGRKPVRTVLAGQAERAEVYADVAARVARGERAFVVVPTIGDDDGPTLLPQAEGEAAELLSVRALMKELSEGPLAGRAIAAMHGRLDRPTRDAVMERFRRGAVEVLVATTVIEVGVDVPEATVMVVEHADRFGLAQLHQLRGRVGRGERPAVCYLVGDPATETGRRRLEVMAAVHDGFVLAEKDLEIRGPGELFGTRQSGLPPFTVADLMNDLDLLGLARRDAGEWIARSPDLARPEESVLKRRLLKTYGPSLGLGDIG